MRYLFFVIIFIPLSVFAKDNPKVLMDNASSYQIPFNSEKFDLSYQFSNDGSGVEQVNKKKSVALAALFSAVIPGAGEFYSEAWVRGGIFLGIEGMLFTGYFIYENKGDDMDVVMRSYGDTHWWDRKYWGKVYTDANNLGVWQGDPLVLDEHGQISEADYNRYIEYFQSLQYNPDLGYTHQLPDTKTQQYYEMIYKYQHQFGIGWDDFISTEKLSPNTIEYRDMRNDSNDYYQAATTMLNLVMLNHLISAIDAAFVANKYNTKVKLSLQAYPRYVGRELIGVYGLSIAW